MSTNLVDSTKDKVDSSRAQTLGFFFGGGGGGGQS